MKKYTDAFFIQEAQRFYKKHKRVPKVRDFRWGSTALRRFGSWKIFLEEAKVVPEKCEGEAYQKKKKDILWEELLSITFHQGWDKEEKKLCRVNQLRKEIDSMNM